MDLVGACAVKVAVEFRESGAFPVVAIFKPLAWCPDFIYSGHIS